MSAVSSQIQARTRLHSRSALKADIWRVIDKLTKFGCAGFMRLEYKSLQSVQASIGNISLLGRVVICFGVSSGFWSSASHV